MNNASPRFHRGVPFWPFLEFRFTVAQYDMNDGARYKRREGETDVEKF
jgi:hypothetical protein